MGVPSSISHLSAIAQTEKCKWYIPDVNKKLMTFPCNFGRDSAVVVTGPIRAMIRKESANIVSWQGAAAFCKRRAGKDGDAQ